MTLARGRGDGDAARRQTPPAARPHPAMLAVPFGLMFFCAAVTSPSDFASHQGDLGFYLGKATALVSGQVPYRDVALEYPPLALVPMVVPYLLWPFGEVTHDQYKWLFAAWEATLLVALALVLARVVVLGGHGDLGRPGRREPVAARGDARLVRNTTVRLWILSAGAALVLAWRFDLFPALLATVALWAALAGRPVTAGIAVGLGVLSKLYPIALVPALAVMWLVRLDVPRLARFAGAAAITIVAGLAPFVAVAGSSALSFLGYQAERGLQLESVASGLILLVGLVTGQPPPINHLFSSVQVEGPLASAALAGLPLLTIAGFGVLAWVGWRRTQADVDRAGQVAPRTVVLLGAGSILVLLLTSKVFSIQYVVWIVPFAALLPRPQFWLAAAALALTMPIHPGFYAELVEQDALPILLLNVRNALLVVVLGLIVRDLWRGSAPGAASVSRSG